MSLARQLKREVKANPAKAAGLGVLLLIAIWFWAPLVSGYFGSGEVEPAAANPAPAPATAASSTPQTAAGPSTSVAGVSPEASYDSRKHALAMDEDPRMNTVKQLPTDRDPFVVAKLPAEMQAALAAEQQAEKQRQSHSAPPIVPGDVGLVLTSTLVSARQQVAEINGKSYRRGDRVRGVKDDTEATFEIVEVEPRLVVLKRNGDRFELKMRRPLVDASGKLDTQQPAPSFRSPTSNSYTGQTIAAPAPDEDDDE